MSTVFGSRRLSCPSLSISWQTEDALFLDLCSMLGSLRGMIVVIELEELLEMLP